MRDRFERARKREEKKKQREEKRERKRMERTLKREEKYEAIWAKAEKLSPPGFDVHYLRTVYPIALALSQVALFVDFISRWNKAESHIEVYRIGEILQITGELPGYLYLLTCALRWPGNVMLLFLVMVIGNYTYYFQESKSIYVMKRISDRFEIHRRAWTVPVCLAVGIAMATVLTALLCMVIYLTCSRQMCLPDQWFNWDSGVLKEIW